MIRETKYIIRRIIIGVGIAFCMTFLNSCEVHAETYSINTNSVSFNTTGVAGLTGNTDTLYTNNNVQAYWGFTQTVELGDNLQVLNPGQYLIEFYVFSNSQTLASRTTCNVLTSNFQNVNMTTGNWVSNEINSQCVDVYATTYNGRFAYRILYKFNYTGARTGADGITELRFNLSSSPNDWFYGTTYGLSSSNIYDYDINIVNQFQEYKQNQVIINGQQDIINSQNSNTQNIINNQDSNTQDIINNQDNNTQDIIDNQNDNTDREIESEKVCTAIIIDKYDLEQKGYVLNNLGVPTPVSNATVGVTGFYELSNNSTIKAIDKDSNGGRRLCFYSSNATSSVISCIEPYTLTINNFINIPSNAKYVRFSIDYSTNLPQYDFYTCINGNQAINDSMNNLNDSINNDNVDSANSSANEWASKNASDNVVSDMVTMPITLLNAYLNGLNGTCSSFSLGNLMGTDLTLPCIDLSSYFGSLWNVIDVLFSGFMIFAIGKKFVKIFNDFTNLKDNQVNELYGGGN